MKKILLIGLLMGFCGACLAQVFEKHNFQVQSKQGKLEFFTSFPTSDHQDSVQVYQFVKKDGKYTSYYRMIVMSIAKPVDKYLFMDKLLENYAQKGKVIKTDFGGSRAVKTVVDKMFTYIPMKEITLSTLYKNQSITFQLDTDSPDYEQMVSDFDAAFSFL